MPTKEMTFLFEHPNGTFPLLTFTNWPSWSGNMSKYLSTLGFPDMTTLSGLEAESELATSYTLPPDKHAQVAAAIYFGCSQPIRTMFLKQMSDPAAMWKTLRSHLDLSRTTWGRMRIAGMFRACMPDPKESLTGWLERLLELWSWAQGSEEPMSPEMFTAQVKAGLYASERDQKKGMEPLQILNRAGSVEEVVREIAMLEEQMGPVL